MNIKNMNYPQKLPFTIASVCAKHYKKKKIKIETFLQSPFRDLESNMRKEIPSMASISKTAALVSVRR